MKELKKYEEFKEEEWEPIEFINGIPIKYKNKRTGKVISNLEYVKLKIQKILGAKL